MATRITLKSYFETGDKPTQAQFEALIDSFWHKTDDTLSIDWANVTGKPATFAPTAHAHAWADVTGKPSFATVATTGAYADLTGIPTTFTPTAHTHAWADVTGKPTFATVATTGAYTDLSGIPTTFAPSAHTHAWADVTGKPATFAPSAHTHAASDIVSGVLNSARLANGTATDGYVVKMVTGVPTWAVDAGGGGGSGWSLSGNSGTTGGTNFVGTTDAQRFDIRANNVILGQFMPNGNVVFNDLASAAGSNNFVAGYAASATGSLGVAIGTNSTISNIAAIAVGNMAQSTHYYSFVIGNKGSAPSRYQSNRDDGMVLGAYAGFDIQQTPNTNVVQIAGASNRSIDLPENNRAMKVNRGTTTQKNAITAEEGMVYYDTTLHKLYCYDGTSWQACW